MNTTTTAPAAKKTAPVNQFAWHRNPNAGAANGPCEVCGCAGKIRAMHRALKADELTRGAAYVKSVSIAWGFDSEWAYLDWNGNKV